MEFYIFEDDAIGRLVRDVLMEKARAGVEVRVIYDDVGCWHVPNRFFEEMREAGIEVRSFLKVRFPLFTSKVNYRNHRKIVVIDGRIGFVGGMNLAERYMRGFSWGIWRHTSAAGGQGCSRIADRLPTRLVLCGPYTDYVYPLFPENRKLRYFLGADCNE